MSTAGRLRNGSASNVFVRTKTKVYVRERPSDPEAIGGLLPYRESSSTTTDLYCEEIAQHPPRGRARSWRRLPKSHSTHIYTKYNSREFLESLGADQTTRSKTEARETASNSV